MQSGQLPLLALPKWSRCQGMSMVEMLISLLLASTLSLAISGVYLQSLQNFRAENELIRLQDNGRYALGLLRRELVHMGFIGGIVAAGETPATAVSTDCVVGGNWALDVARPLDFINNFSPDSVTSLGTLMGVSLSCLEREDIRAGTDIISVKRTAANYTVKNGAYLPNSRLRNSQWYLRSEQNGEMRNWFYHRSGSLPAGDIGVRTQVDYWEYFAKIFYIRSFSETPSDQVPSLCVERLSGGSSLGKMKTHCLVEGVEDMQLEFGVDLDLDRSPDIFKANPTAAELSSAVVARLYLLMRSVSEVPAYARPRHFFLGGKRVDRSDGYVRQVLSATVNLPNLHLSQR